MTNQIITNHIHESNTASQWIGQSVPKDSTHKSRVQTQDQLVSGSQQSREQILPTVRRVPPLPVPTHQPKPALERLAEAFSEAFVAMGGGLKYQAIQFAKLQELDQTESQIVLASTTAALAKQAKEAHVEQHLLHIEQTIEKQAEDLLIASFTVGIVLLIVTAGAGLLTLLPEYFPSIAAVLPEFLGGSGSAVDEGLELDSLSEDVDVDSEIQELENGNFADNGGDSIEMDNMDKTATDNTSNVSRTIKKSAWGASIRKFILKEIITACLASPTLVQGYAKTEIAKQYFKLVPIQQQIGQTLANMQTNNGNFQFLQNLLQRENSSFVNEIQGTGDILQTFGEITGSYQSIAAQLANSV